MTSEQWIEFVAAAMPALTGGLVALATAILAFFLNDRAARKRQLRDRQDAALEHVMDMFGRMQESERDVQSDDFMRGMVDALVDSLLRFTWLLDARDEIVTNWVNAKGLETVRGLKSAASRADWVGMQKTTVVLRLRDWRVRPIRTRQLMRREFKAMGTPAWREAS